MTADEPAVASREDPFPDLGWMGVPGAATRLGITTRTLYRFINDGDLVAYKIGRVIRIKQADLDTFIESVRIEPGSLEHLVPRRDEEPGGDGDESPSTA